MKAIAIIPARMAATRFPGKPLANMLGLPMIEHIRRRVLLSKHLSAVYVATCDQEIFDAVAGAGGNAIMTADTHVRCTDRIAEAAIDLSADIVINIQGDEPLIHPDMLPELIEPFLNEPDLQCTNLVSDLNSDEEFNGPNDVKVVMDLKGNILYFSREPIPSVKKAQGRPFARFKQTGIIAFRSKFLQEFTRLPPTPNEEIESVDMLRALEHGHKVRGVITKFKTVSVDTPQELELAIDLLRKDPLLPAYMAKS